MKPASEGKSDLSRRTVLDAFASKDTIKKKSTIDLRINSVLIRRGQVYYDLLSEAQTPGRFNSNHLGLLVKLIHLPVTLHLS